MSLPEIQWVARLTPEGREAIRAAFDGVDDEAPMCTLCADRTYDDGCWDATVPASTLVAFDDSTEGQDVTVLCNDCYNDFRKSSTFFEIAAVLHLPDYECLECLDTGILQNSYTCESCKGGGDDGAPDQPASDAMSTKDSQWGR